MGGFHRSPVLRDDWTDPRDMDKRRGRGSHRDRGRNRHRDRGRHSRHSDRHIENSDKSPPSYGPRSGLDQSHGPSDSGILRSPPRGPSGRSSDFHENRRIDRSRPPSSANRKDLLSGPFERDEPALRRDDTFAPPSKRKRTRSPSPHGRGGSFPQRRPSFNKHGGRREYSPPPKNRGRFPGRGAPRRRSPRRGRDRRGKDWHRADQQRGRSRSPGLDTAVHQSPGRRSRSLSRDELSDRNSRYNSRSPSRHSVRSTNSRSSPLSSNVRGAGAFNLTRSTRPAAGGERSGSPPQPIPSFQSDRFDDSGDEPPRIRDMPSNHGMRSQNGQRKQGRQPSRTDLDPSSYSTYPNFATSNNSRHGSPPPTSPRAGKREGFGGPPRHPRSGASTHREGHFNSPDAPLGQYQQPESHPYEGGSDHQPRSHGGETYRGAHSGSRGGHIHHGSDRRFSGSGPPSYHNDFSHRGGRGNFNNAQWAPSAPRGRGEHQSPRIHNHGSRTPSTRPPSAGGPHSPHTPNNEDDFWSSNRGFERGDDRRQQLTDNGNFSGQPPSTQAANGPAPPSKGGKFSFTFKAKTTPAPAPKPVPDLAQRMQIREPPPRAPAADPPTPRNRLTNGPLPTYKPEPRFNRRERGRDRERDRDRRDFRDQRDFREPRDRRDDHRSDQRRDRRKNDRHPDFRHPDRRKDFSPEPSRGPPPKQKKILTRPKPRPTLPQEFADADSVYYRKPGNESVIGAGTYGKVFKGIHVYTQRKVALKKIRMEGEKDGFPVTAMREIKLLQHLRNHNVVSLLEVMVERNECFMVFEYLSHDLTGLINHPTFSLTLAHKKDLAKQMFEGLNYLHHRGVLHRDIKAANILISNRGLLKYADFGLARFFSKHRQLDYTNRVITIWYRPPELLLGETRYGPAVDVWSAACVCMEMFTKKAVFPGEGGELSQLDKLYNCLGTPTRADWPGLTEMPWFQLMRPSERKKRVFEDIYQDVLTPAAMNLITQIFQYDPAKRPTAEEVLQHAYFVSEEPTPQQAMELEHIEGDWHEFESKALRKEARRAEYQTQRDREKRKAEPSVSTSDRDSKRARPDATDQTSGAA